MEQQAESPQQEQPQQDIVENVLAQAEQAFHTGRVPGEEEPVQEEAPQGEPEKTAQAEQTAQPEEDIEKLLQRDAQKSKQKRSAAEEKKSAIDELRARAAQDRDAVLKDLGINVSDLVLEYFSSPSVPEEEKPQRSDTRDEVIEKLQALEQKLQQKEQQESQARERQLRQSAVQNSASFLESARESYPVLNAIPGGAELLLNAVVGKYEEDREYYDTNNTAPSFSDLAASVEKYAHKQLKQQLESLAKNETLSNIAREVFGISAPVSSKPKPTLSNQLTTESSDIEEASTEQERLALAIKKLEALDS